MKTTSKTRMNAGTQTKRAIQWTLLSAVVGCSALATGGCELLVDFDRSLIPQEGGLDATTDGPEGDSTAGDSSASETGTDSSADSSGDSATASDASTHDGGGDASATDSSAKDSSTTDSSSTDSSPPTDSGAPDASEAATLFSNGTTCTTAAECSSGNCVTDDTNTSGKVCCATPCTAGSTASCGNDGNCLHSGSACADYASGTVCTAATCVDSANSSTATPAADCNGAGTCSTATPVACGTYKCNGNVCGTSCTGDGNCATGNYCDGTSCVALKAVGSACTASDQCASPGVCNVDCCASSTACAAASCNTITNLFTPASSCDGTGACTIPTAAACGGGLICASATACATTCTAGTTTGCADILTTTCNAAGTACLLNTGEPCTSGAQCLNGTCSGTPSLCN